MGFAGHLKLVTTSNNNSSWIYKIYNSLWHALSLLSQLCLHLSSGKGFQWQMFHFLWAIELILCLSHGNSHLTKFQKLISHYWISKRHSRRLSLHKSNFSNLKVKSQENGTEKSCQKSESYYV
jgi:hypothetical protein